MDTSFLIRLLDEADEDHNHALSYYRRFRNEKVELLLSSIVMAEYGVKDDIDNLPIQVSKVVSFNPDHARLAAAFSKAAYEARRKGRVVLEHRVVIPNDTKLLAQAQIEKVDLFIARDNNCTTVHKFLKEKGLVNFKMIDLRTPPNQFFGELFPE